MQHPAERPELAERPQDGLPRPLPLGELGRQRDRPRCGDDLPAVDRVEQLGDRRRGLLGDVLLQRGLPRDRLGELGQARGRPLVERAVPVGDARVDVGDRALRPSEVEGLQRTRGRSGRDRRQAGGGHQQQGPAPHAGGNIAVPHDHGNLGRVHPFGQGQGVAIQGARGVELEDEGAVGGLGAVDLAHEEVHEHAIERPVDLHDLDRGNVRLARGRRCEGEDGTGHDEPGEDRQTQEAHRPIVASRRRGSRGASGTPFGLVRLGSGWEPPPLRSRSILRDTPCRGARRPHRHATGHLIAHAIGGVMPRAVPSRTTTSRGLHPRRPDPRPRCGPTLTGRTRSSTC